jgi:hypothetical protein
MTESMRDKNLWEVGSLAPQRPSEWGVPIYSWLAISNYSPYDKHWWVRGVEMPYEIVLLPGYRRPKSLVMHDIDSIWYDGDLKDPLVIWDGEFAENLFEMISVCMDPAAEMVDFIKVRDRKTGAYVKDVRPTEMLRSRPQREYVGEMIDYHRLMERKKFVEVLIPQYYRDWRQKTQAWCSSGGFSACYKWKSKDSDRCAPAHWRLMARRHPDVDERVLRDYEPEKVQVVPGVKFGLRLFQKEVAKHPSWIKEQLQLDYYVAIGEEFVSTAYQQVSFKQTRGIPLTEEDLKILNKGGDYATPGVRGFLNKFYDSMRRA